MIYQQRPFFRKKIKLSTNFLPHSIQYFKNHNKFNKNTQSNKLSPHKFKRLTLKKMSYNFLPTPVRFSLFFKVIFLELTSINTINTMIYKNKLGVIFKTLYLNGCLPNTILFQSFFYNHWYLHIESMKWKLVGTNICSSIQPVETKKIFGLKTFQNMIALNDGTLKLLLAHKTIFLSKTFFLLGITSKFNTRNVTRVSSVRGISKNPVDHPNGGRANTKGSFKTPWGTIAKANK